MHEVGEHAPKGAGVLLGQDTLSGVLTFADSTYSSYGTRFVRQPGQ